MDPLILSRIQFAANISFHILFPSITIALGWVLLFFKLRYTRDRRQRLDARLFHLGEGVRAGLRAGRRLRRHHELPVRHQLAGLHGEGRQHRRAAAGLRDPHRLLPRGGVPRHHAVRLPPRLEPRAHAGHLPRRLRHHRCRPSGSWRSTPGCRRRPATRCATASPMSLDWWAVDLQSVLPLPPHPHAARLGAHRLVLHRRPVGAALSRRRPLGIDVEGAAHRRLHAPPS